jgi:SAM-dependent methyltransferase
VPKQESGENSSYDKHYEQLAATDLDNPIVTVDWLECQARNLVRYIGPVDGLSVCDVGCGRGVLSRLLIEHGATVTAVDLSMAYLKNLSNAVPSIRVLCCDADSLPFEEEFDAIVSTDVMEHTLRPGGFLYSINHALKSGGTAYIRVPYRENLLAYAPQVGCLHPYVHLRSYNLPLLRDAFEGAGFSINRMYLDGFSLGTPQEWFNGRSAFRNDIYSKFVSYARSRLRSDADINSWPHWLVRIFMKPLEVVVCATKTKVIMPAPGGTVFRLEECALAS